MKDRRRIDRGVEGRPGPSGAGNGGQLRSFGKRLVERVVSGSRLGHLSLALTSRSILVLSYHNIVPDGDPPRGDVSLHLPISLFRAHLDMLGKAYSIVSFPDLVSGRLGSGEKLALVTFDDAYRGTLTLGLKELRARNLPGVVFVPTGLLGCGGFWWDRLADPGVGAVARAFRDEAFHKLGGLQEEIIRAAETRHLTDETMPPLWQPATGAELVEAMRSNPRVAFESHTWTHPHLPSLPEPEIRSQLLRSRKWLEERGGGELGLLSYPYGAVTDDVARIAGEVGFKAAFLVTGGRMTPSVFRSDPLRLPRLNVPRGLSKEGFWMRISGALGG